MKFCFKCQTDKDLSAFNKNASTKDGLQRYCAECYRAVKAANYIKHKTKLLADSAEYYRLKKPEVLARNADYYARNKTKVLATQSAWRALNSDKMRALTTRWMKANPHMRSIYNSKRRARLFSAHGSFTHNEILTLFALQKGQCACCHEPLKSNFHKDHITPLALGGDNDKLNIQLLCPRCNLSKGKKDPIKFMQERGYLL